MLQVSFLLRLKTFEALQVLLELPELRSDEILFPGPLCSVLVEGAILLLEGTNLRLQVLLYFLVHRLLALKSLHPQS